ncbi:hypothetical protein [Stutzerimonas nitrititolerans]|uniref:hypothetical protein n=1 Tax=Stutzerimonas nitrititolerans TaxID=2482751 RepID=UPI0028A85DCB|nr:hypothetical protein [Stutzerimonas nitrititolerans]
MNFINNWLREITLEQGAESCPLDLPSGDYRLTLADAASGATRWEIVDAVVLGGAATLVRAREGTADQEWSAGSVIYCDVTAGQLNALMSRIVQLENEVTSLSDRVAALEGGGIPDGALTDNDGNALVDANGNYLTMGV